MLQKIYSIFNNRKQTNTIKLYHMSTSPFIEREFIPMTPQHKLEKESSVPRLCLSSTMSGCAIGIGVDKVLRTYQACGFVLLYTFEIEDDCEYLFSPDEVSSKFNVSDAVENDEYCYTGKSIKPSKVEFLRVVGKTTIVKIERIGFSLSCYLRMKFLISVFKSWCLPC